MMRFFWPVSLGFNVMLSAMAYAAPQPLHLCAPPIEPIEDPNLLARHDMVPEDEYNRYFNELNDYLLCLQRSQADIIEKGNFWHQRYMELFERE